MRPAALRGHHLPCAPRCQSAAAAPTNNGSDMLPPCLSCSPHHVPATLPGRGHQQHALNMSACMPGCCRVTINAMGDMVVRPTPLECSLLQVGGLLAMGLTTFDQGASWTVD